MNGNSNPFIEIGEPARELHAKSIDGNLTVKIWKADVGLFRVSE